MDDVYYHFMPVLIPAILAVVLVGKTKNLAGKNWLLASIIITLAQSVIMMLATQVPSIREFITYQIEDVYIDVPAVWYSVTELIDAIRHFGVACFGIFLLIVWSHARIKVNVKQLLFSFNGRIPRSLLWIVGGIIGPLNLNIAYHIVEPIMAYGDAPELIISIIHLCWLILMVWIMFAVYAKRLHDCSKSAWMMLIALIPIVGPVWFIIYVGFIRGTKGPNPYGEDPLKMIRQET